LKPGHDLVVQRLVVACLLERIEMQTGDCWTCRPLGVERYKPLYGLDGATGIAVLP
jgi:hypothetical protein